MAWFPQYLRLRVFRRGNVWKTGSCSVGLQGCGGGKATSVGRHFSADSSSYLVTNSTLGFGTLKPWGGTHRLPELLRSWLPRKQLPLGSSRLVWLSKATAAPSFKKMLLSLWVCLVDLEGGVKGVVWPLRWAAPSLGPVLRTQQRQS